MEPILLGVGIVHDILNVIVIVAFLSMHFYWQFKFNSRLRVRMIALEAAILRDREIIIIHEESSVQEEYADEEPVSDQWDEETSWLPANDDEDDEDEATVLRFPI